jgi:hypothetical protein
MSTDNAPCIKPVKPPIEKRKINARAYNIGGSSEIDPLYKVAVQLKTLIALGIATRKVRSEKTNWPLSLIPTANI